MAKIAQSGRYMLSNRPVYRPKPCNAWLTPPQTRFIGGYANVRVDRCSYSIIIMGAVSWLPLDYV